MSLNLPKYDQYFFDCDGVILQSNHIKSEGFFRVAKSFSPELATDFLKYHQTNGGISRFEKFKYFFAEMMKLSEFQNEMDQALKLFKEICVSELLICKNVEGVSEFLSSIDRNAKKYVVSGGLQDEVALALTTKGLDKHFNGIYGSPRTKFDIMKSIVIQESKGIFFGDAKLDFEVSQHFKCDFVFISGHTEFSDYQEYFKNKTCGMIENFLSV